MERALEQIKRDKQKTNDIKQRSAAYNSTPDDMEMEIPKPVFGPLNRQHSAFDTATGNRWGGINSAPSVFDAQTKIHTEQK